MIFSLCIVKSYNMCCYIVPSACFKFTTIVLETAAILVQKIQMFLPFHEELNPLILKWNPFGAAD